MKRNGKHYFARCPAIYLQIVISTTSSLIKRNGKYYFARCPAMYLQIIRRPRLQQGERVRGGITSSKGQQVITSSKGKKQENKKEEARSKKQFRQARSVPQGPAVWLWRRRRFGSDS